MTFAKVSGGPVEEVPLGSGSAGAATVTLSGDLPASNGSPYDKR